MKNIDEDDKRHCDDCGTEMTEGYCIDGGTEYYCSDECLHKHYTPKEWKKLYNKGNSDSYWTEWEERDEKELEEIKRIENDN